MLKNNNNLLTVNHGVLILPLTLNHSLLFFKRFYPGRVPSSGKGPNLKLLTPTNKSTLPVVPKRSTSSLKKPSSRISQKRHSSIPPLRKPIDEQYEASHPQPPTTHSSAPAHSPAPLPAAPAAPPAPSAPPGPPAPSGPPAHFPFVPAP